MNSPYFTVRVTVTDGATGRETVSHRIGYGAEAAQDFAIAATIAVMMPIWPHWDGLDGTGYSAALAAERYRDAWEAFLAAY